MTRDYPPITLPGSIFRKLYSSALDKEFRLSIYLPPNYEDSDDSYPVVYFLDAYLWGAIFPEIARTLNFAGELPELVLVGIEADIDGPTGWISQRNINLIPIMGNDTDQIKDNPGGDGFYRFIREELIPYMEGTFRASPDGRTLAGSSLGGLFVLYALFNYQHDFENFLVFSPGLTWNDGSIFNIEETYAKNNQDLRARLFLAVGSEEDDTPINKLNPERGFITNLQKLNDILGKREYEHLDMKMEILDGESHTSMCSPAFQRGLKWIFGKKSIAKKMIQTYQEQDFRTAVNEYHELKETKPGEYTFQEPELNNLGYAFLYSGKVAEAIEIFKLNIENFPKSANVYDSLGEAFATSGETEKAIESYMKALEVDPQTHSAIEALKQLEGEPQK